MLNPCFEKDGAVNGFNDLVKKTTTTTINVRIDEKIREVNMSDYKSMRIKKTHELEAAISSVPKDLYQWNKPADSSSKRSSLGGTRGADDTSSMSSLPSPSMRRQQHAPSFPAPPARIKPLQSTLKLKRPNSLKDLDKSASSGVRTRPLNSAQPITSANTNNNTITSPNDYDLLIIEDLSDSSWSDFNSRPKSVNNTDRPYLNTGRKKSPGPASFRDVSDREAEIVSSLGLKYSSKLKNTFFFLALI